MNMNTVTETEVEEDVTETGPDSRDTTSSAPTPVPTKEELELICKDVKETLKFDVSVKPVIFRFKTTKDAATGTETKREALELPIPYPTPKGILDIIEAGGAGLALLQDAIEYTVNQVARGFISDDMELNATNFPFDKLTWEAIANMPKPERSGGGIAKEVWEDFVKDYVKVMPEATGKSVDKIERAAKILLQKFSSVKTNVDVIEFLTGQLAVYMEASTRAEEFTDCIEFLVDKADKLINVTPEELLAAL